MESFDLIVVGAGFRGLAIAKTYHQIHPDKSILVLDSAETIGGCWATENIYEGLNTNNTYGSYEFDDFPMKAETGETRPGIHIPGSTVQKYLSDAARFYDVDRFIRLQTKVVSALLRDDESWEISFRSTTVPVVHGKILCTALVIASGVSNEPMMPTFAGQDKFQGLLFHSKQLRVRSDALYKAKKVIVIGGNKSALDASFNVAHSGGIVHMLLRRSGAGPSYSWPPVIKWLGNLIPPILLMMTRFYTLFDPWPFTPKVSWIREFLHRSTLGLWITNSFWKAYTKSYTERMKGDPRTEKLIPWSSTYWMSTSTSSHNYPADFLQYVREGKIVIHHADVISLGSNEAYLTDSTLQNVDAIICATGYKPIPAIKFLPEGLEEMVGIPRDHMVHQDAEAVQQARRYIYNRRPFLKKPPRTTRDEEPAEVINALDQDSTPFRLYRGLVPPNKRFLLARNLAFIGADTCLSTSLVTVAEALWITAFLDNKISHLQPLNLDVEEVRKETFLWPEYFRIRRPPRAGGFGERFPDMCFDCVPYVDLLLSDLRLQTKRKTSFFQHWFTPNGMGDYKNIVPEWQRSIKKGE